MAHTASQDRLPDPSAKLDKKSRVPEILERLADRGLPNLFVPRLDQFVQVDTIPLLGTGKLDLREIKNAATEALKQTD